MIRELIQKYFSSPKPLEYNLWTSTKKDWDYSLFTQPLTPQEIETLSNADIGELPKSVEKWLEQTFDPALTHRGHETSCLTNA